MLKYPICNGGNRERVKIYLDGSKSSNTIFSVASTGMVSIIVHKENVGYKAIIVDVSDGYWVVYIMSLGLELVSNVEPIKFNQPLTNNYNV